MFTEIKNDCSNTKLFCSRFPSNVKVNACLNASDAFIIFGTIFMDVVQLCVHLVGRIAVTEYSRVGLQIQVAVS
jgi:hypothetical protein